MQLTRRHLAALLPALAQAADKTPMPSATFNHDDLKVKTNGENTSRDFFSGYTHSGFHIDMHETDLAPGMAPHAAHHHEHEELLMLRTGTLEVTIDGKVTKAGPGSAIYVASGLEHGWRNVGTTRAAYFVMALGRDPK